MRFSAILKHTGYERLRPGDPEISSVVKDAAKARPGSLYVCIQGISGDGHDHIAEAAANGAAAIVCDKRLPEYPSGMAAALVKNSRLALGFICKNFCGDPLAGINVTGVTGTNGKTSVTYFLEAIYGAAGRLGGVIGTSGVRIGGKPLDFAFATATTPDPIELFEIFRLMRGSGVREIVMEATSHALALDKVGAVSFNHGIFTNLTQDHLEFHGSFENYLAAKKKLFALSETGIINADDAYGARLAESGPRGFYTYGVENKADFKAKNISYTKGGSYFDLMAMGERIDGFFLPIPGGFSVYNALGAIASALLAGVSPGDVKRGLASVKAIPGRIQPVENDAGLSVIVDYAHTPDGLEKVIKAVRSFTGGRVITVFGCGGDRDRTKRPLMGKIAGALSDFCVVTSDNPRSEKPEDIIAEILPGLLSSGCKYTAEPDRKAAIHAAIGMIGPDDAVIIAGKGHEDYQEFENKRRVRFDDREVAAARLRRE